MQPDLARIARHMADLTTTDELDGYAIGLKHQNIHTPEAAYLLAQRRREIERK